jgi:hypothetical protein
MAKLGGGAAKLVDIALRRYNVPEWARIYIYKYAARNKLATIRHAIGMVSIGRKKGRITNESVTLPNGMSFRMDSIVKLLSLFFHCAQSIAKLEEHWTTSYNVGNPEYEARFSELAMQDFARARAIKNLIEGLKYRVSAEPESIKPLFDRLAQIDDWNERLLTMGIVLDYSLVKTFGIPFYKVFYPTVPEFMRSFGKAFTPKQGAERWCFTEASSLIASGRMPADQALGLSRELLMLVRESIDRNTALAKELKIEKEISLLREIAIAYPLHTLRDAGMPIDPEAEVSRILKQARG